MARILIVTLPATGHISPLLPLVAGGQTADKAEIYARIARSGVGINLNTDTPIAEQLRQSARSVLNDPHYRAKAQAIQKEFASYEGPGLGAQLLEELAGR